MSNMISIIVPVYNSELYLKKCLDSIISQTYENIEIICVDDNSSDDSLRILQEYEKKDHRIKVIQKANEGVSLARNVGLDVAHGDYILFVDSDDWIDISTCEVALKKITEETADLVMWSYIRERETESSKKQIFDCDIIFEGKKVQEKLHRRMIGIVEDELARPENADALCTVWGKLYCRTIISANHIRFYDIRKIGTYEDGLFNLEYLKYVQKAIFLNQYFYHYRRTNVNSITGAYNANLGRQWDTLFHIMDKYIEQNGLNKKYQEALHNRISLSLIPLGINEMTNDCSMGMKMVKIKEIISQKRYIDSINSLKIQYMPIHWKVFFRAAKRKNTFIILIMLIAIQKIRGR